MRADSRVHPTLPFASDISSDIFDALASRYHIEAVLCDFHRRYS